MKIIEANAGILTNFEVLNYLRSKGASKDPLRDVLGDVTASELKVYDYLIQTPACVQTKESIHEFLEKCTKYNLAKAEILNIINTRPTLPAEIFPIIEEFDTRIEATVDELVEMVVNVLPPPPTNVEEVKDEDSNAKKIEVTDGDKEENLNGEQTDAS